MSKDTIVLFESSLDDISNKNITDDKVASLKDGTEYDTNIFESNHIDTDIYTSTLTIRIDNDSIAFSDIKPIHESFFNYFNNYTSLFDNTIPSFILSHEVAFNDDTGFLCTLPYPFDFTTLSREYDYTYTDLIIKFHKFRKQNFNNFHKFIFKLNSIISNFLSKHSITHKCTIIGWTDPNYQIKSITIYSGHLLSEVSLMHIYACTVLDHKFHPNTSEYNVPNYTHQLNNNNQIDYIKKYYNNFANKAFKIAPKIAKTQYGINLIPINQWFDRDYKNYKSGFITVKVSKPKVKSIRLHEFIDCIFFSIITNIPDYIIKNILSTVYVIIDDSNYINTKTTKDHDITHNWTSNIHTEINTINCTDHSSNISIVYIDEDSKSWLRETGPNAAPEPWELSQSELDNK